MTDGSYQYKVCVGVTQKIHVVPEQIFWSGHTKPTIEPWDALDFAQQQLLIVKFGPNAANANWKRPQTTRKKKRKSISRRRTKASTANTKRERSRKQHEPAMSNPQHKEEVEQHQRSINNDWEEARKRDQAHEARFPELPSRQRINDSIADFRKRMSTPHLTQVCCGVCGEQWNGALIRKFNVADSFLGENTMRTMKVLLKAVHCPPTFKEGHFAGMAVCAKGIDSDANTINICKRCHNSLKSMRRTPHLAVANNLDFGSIPPELQDLNWAEERVISLIRISVHVLNLRGHESPSHRDDESILHQQMKLSGHSFCSSQDVPSINRALPVHPDELPDIIQVKCC